MFNFLRVDMQKLYYSISEVSKMVDEEQHILRYWEKEFSQLRPKKNRGGNRIYSEKDILLITQIKKLLREDKLSLKGAQEQIRRIYELAMPDNDTEETQTTLVNMDKLAENVSSNSNYKEILILNKQDAIELYELLKDVLTVLN